MTKTRILRLLLIAAVAWPFLGGTAAAQEMARTGGAMPDVAIEKKMVTGDVATAMPAEKKAASDVKLPVAIKKAEASSNFVIQPTNLTGSDNVVTAIGSICGDRQVADVYYVSPTGLTSKAPFQGVNIVVTRYTDGSTTTTKIVK